MAPSTFSIELDNPTCTYSPGQTLTGKVVVVLDKSEKCQGLSVEYELVGKFGAISVSSHLCDEEERGLFDNKVYLLGDEHNAKNTIPIPVGNNSYAFQFLLPIYIPSSSNVGKQSYTYSLKASILSSLIDHVHEIEKEFTVVGSLDLNSIPRTMVPAKLRLQKNNCFCCCGPIGFHCTLPKRGFVPGEFIDMEIKIFNKSWMTSVSGIVVGLFQRSRFFKLGYAFTSNTLLGKVKHGKRMCGKKSETWEGKLLQIPSSVPPSQIGIWKYRIIHVSYYIEIQLNIFPARKLRGRIPIIVGSVPLKMESTHPVIPENGNSQ